MSMTYKQIASMIEEVGIPFAYYVFPEDTPQAPPFICFYYPNSANFPADNIAYVPGAALVIELYTSEKNFELENTIETVLTNHGLHWQKTETYLDSEKMLMEVYEMEVFIHG